MFESREGQKVPRVTFRTRTESDWNGQLVGGLEELERWVKKAASAFSPCKLP